MVLSILGKEQNQMEEFGRGPPPPYEEVTRKRIRGMRYGSIDQNGSVSSSRRESEDQSQSQDGYVNDERRFQSETVNETNPFRQ